MIGTLPQPVILSAAKDLGTVSRLGRWVASPVFLPLAVLRERVGVRVIAVRVVAQVM